MARLGLWFFACAVLVAGCGEVAAPSDKARVAEYLQALLVERDWARWPQYFDSSATINGSTFALQILRGTAEGLNYSFADLSIEVREQIEEPGRVATLFVLRGRHERPFNAQPATHKNVELEGFVLDHFRDGKVTESTMILDVWGLSGRVATLGGAGQ
jgi:predicted ester cyclase